MVGTVAPELIVPGTALEVAGEGLVPASVAAYEVLWRGSVAGRAIDVSAEGTLVAVASDAAGAARAAGTLVVTVPDALVLSAPELGAATFEGQLGIRRTSDDHAGDATAWRPLSLLMRSHLTPRAMALAASELYPGDRVVVTGGDLLRRGEGTTLAVFEGRFEDDRGERRIEGLAVPLEAQGARRDAASFALTPDVFGIRPGRFEGSLTLVNVHTDGQERRSASVPVGVSLLRPVLAAVSPLAASRGQRVTVTGRGLLPADGPQQTATILLLEGVFTPRRGLPVSYEGTSALALYPEPDGAGNTSATIVLRTTLGDDGRPSGLGAVAGRFVGRLVPLVLSGPDAIEGPPLPLVFDILNPKQVVHIRFLPGFADALVRFGLLAERPAIEARILEVLARDYAGVNIAFTTSTPSAWNEYAVVEVGGRDPNGTGLLGLDNTDGKDVGNLRFDDVIGGFNAATRAGNFAAYGGVFVSELMALSPRLGEHELASPRFDDIFGSVAPELGGHAAEVGESESFDERGADIRRAVRVLGNLIGTTITHEVGHSLGLTAIAGRYHNEGDNPNWIMDAGQFRPFEERAEIDGFGPGVFEPFNRAYLEDILPLDPIAPP